MKDETANSIVVLVGTKTAGRKYDGGDLLGDAERFLVPKQVYGVLNYESIANVNGQEEGWSVRAQSIGEQ